MDHNNRLWKRILRRIRTGLAELMPAGLIVSQGRMSGWMRGVKGVCTPDPQVDLGCLWWATSIRCNMHEYMGWKFSCFPKFHLPKGKYGNNMDFLFHANNPSGWQLFPCLIIHLMMRSQLVFLEVLGEVVWIWCHNLSSEKESRCKTLYCGICRKRW